MFPYKFLGRNIFLLTVLLIVGTVILLTPTTSFADMLEPGERAVTPCILIENSDEHKDLHFFISSSQVKGLRPVPRNGCANIVYSLSDNYLIAVETSQLPKRDDLYNGDFVSDEEEENLRKNTLYTSEPLNLPATYLVNEQDPRQQNVVAFQVTIKNGTLAAKQTGSKVELRNAELGQLFLIVCILLASLLAVFFSLRKRPQPKNK